MEALVSRGLGDRALAVRVFPRDPVEPEKVDTFQYALKRQDILVGAQMQLAVRPFCPACTAHMPCLYCFLDTNVLCSGVMPSLCTAYVHADLLCSVVLQVFCTANMRAHLLCSAKLILPGCCTAYVHVDLLCECSAATVCAAAFLRTCISPCSRACDFLRIHAFISKSSMTLSRALGIHLPSTL